jgi:isopenicillin N synthase-like dioxygenase
MQELPIIDIQSLGQAGDRRAVAKEIRDACIDKGFFYIKGHGIDEGLEARLEALTQEFFSWPLERKNAYRMELAGRAWRGFFPVGGELTSGKPDWKEGLYFGDEHDDSHPLVLSRTPLHGKNLFPDLNGFRETVLEYLKAMTLLSHQLMEGIALSLGLEDNFFRKNYTGDPTLLFRIFHYPPPPEGMKVWGVGEHSDYGLLTILKQDKVGGLEVKSKDAWISAPPIANTFVCNIGDMLDRLTRGLYRSTPHRVQNKTQKERYSFPFFFDPSFSAEIKALPLDPSLFSKEVKMASEERWDKADVHSFQGSYGDYLLGKVGKVFPELKVSTK